MVLDLSAAFDTIDHTILLDRLNKRFGFEGVVLDWFRSFLCDRTQKVMVGSMMSKATELIAQPMLQMDFVTFCGAYIGKYFDWNEHINKTCNQLSKHIQQ